MAKTQSPKPELASVSTDDLRREIARREIAEFGSDLTSMELAVEAGKQHYGHLALQERLDAVPPEDGLPRKCPRCGNLVPVKAEHRVRRLQTLSGEVRYFRNYHYCKKCRHGFYPRDDELGIPENGNVSRELEKRLLDFGINDSYEQAAERWNIHYSKKISSNLLRRVVDRVGDLLDECHDAALHHELKKVPEQAPELLVVQTDGSMLPMRGKEPWKEAKLAVVFDGQHWLRGDKGRRGVITQSRYVGVLGEQKEFKAALDVALRMERALKTETVVWVADGAPGNWCLAEDLVPGAVQILDFQHAVEHAMTCAKTLFGEMSPWLPLWRERVQQLLLSNGPETVVAELEQCLFLAPRRERGALKDLLRYYRWNVERMRYREFLDRSYPIGSGIVESGHRHVLQKRMKNAGQHWSPTRGRRMVQLRAAYRTAGAQRFHSALLRARTLTRTGKIPRFGPLKRRASNYGTVGFQPKHRGRHSRY